MLHKDPAEQLQLFGPEGLQLSSFLQHLLRFAIVAFSQKAISEQQALPCVRRRPSSFFIKLDQFKWVGTFFEFSILRSLVVSEAFQRKNSLFASLAVSHNQRRIFHKSIVIRTGSIEQKMRV